MHCLDIGSPMATVQMHLHSMFQVLKGWVQFVSAAADRMIRRVPGMRCPIGGVAMGRNRAAALGATIGLSAAAMFSLVGAWAGPGHGRAGGNSGVAAPARR